MTALEPLTDAHVKALATAAFVGLLMALMRRAGPRDRQRLTPPD